MGFKELGGRAWKVEIFPEKKIHNIYSHLVFQAEKIFTRSVGDGGRVSPDMGAPQPEQGLPFLRWALGQAQQLHQGLGTRDAKGKKKNNNPNKQNFHKNN